MTMSYEVPSQSSKPSSSKSMSGSTVHGFLILQVQLTKNGCIEVATAPIVEKHHRCWRFYCAFSTILIATFIIALDETTKSVALPVSHPLGFKRRCPHLAHHGTACRLSRERSTPPPWKGIGADRAFPLLRLSFSLLTSFSSSFSCWTRDRPAPLLIYG